MAIALNDNIQIVASKLVDNKYGPYTSVTTALTTLSAFIRARGQTVGITENNTLKEYWFKDGIADINLIEKTSSGTGADTALRSLTANWETTYTTVSSLSSLWSSNAQKQYKSDYVGNSATYIGTASYTASESSPSWTIKKSIFSSTGTFISSASSVNIAWTNRYIL
jgi:hypothetical protein